MIDPGDLVDVLLHIFMYDYGYPPWYMPCWSGFVLSGMADDVIIL